MKYFSAVEQFPLDDLDLWSRDGVNFFIVNMKSSVNGSKNFPCMSLVFSFLQVHLSDGKGMAILCNLLWSATKQQLGTQPATSASPRPSPPLAPQEPSVSPRPSPPLAPPVLSVSPRPSPPVREVREVASAPRSHGVRAQGSKVIDSVMFV